MTAAATLATAPLIAFHFGELSTVTLVANLLALPAVAPAMWLGMLAAAAGQVPGFPVEAVNAARRACCSPTSPRSPPGARGPSWASVEVSLGPGGLVGSYAAIAAARALRPAPAAPPAGIALAAGRRSSAARCWPRLRAARGSASLAGRRSPAPAGRAAAARRRPADHGPRRRPGRRDPAAAGRGAARSSSTAARPATAWPRKLREAGVERLAAAVVTHDQSDHAGGIEEAARRGADRDACSTGSPAAGCSGRPRAAGVPAEPGRRRRPAALGPPPPRRSSGRRRRCSTAPTPARTPTAWRWSPSPAGAASRCCSPPTPRPSRPRSTPVRSTCSRSPTTAARTPGLDGLLERTMPRLAVISVGEDNPYGHPTAATLATLAAHGVPHPAHRSRRHGRHRGARRLGGGPHRSLSATLRPDGSPTEYSEFRHATLAARPRAADATTR